MAMREDYGIDEALWLQQQTAPTSRLHPSPTGVVPNEHDAGGGIPREVHIPTDSEESNHHSDSCGEEESTGSPPSIACPATADEREAWRNTNTAAANMLLMLARS
jgi:hypothetical protein